MTVGVVTAFLGNLRAGTWVYTANLLSRMPEGVVAVDREQRQFPDLPGFPVRAYPGGRRLGKIVWPNLILPSAAARDRLKLVHTTTPFGTAVDTPYRKVITICDATPLLFPSAHGRLNVLHHRYLLPRILAQADRVVTISESSRRDILKFYRLPEDKVTVTLLAADSRFRPDPEGDAPEWLRAFPKPYILNVGTLEPRKNVEGLVRAFARAKQKGIPHKLLLVGARGWGEERLAAVMESCGVAGEVVVAGFVKDADLPHLYANADFFVYPSLYEGFGLPPLEAMASGCPVVTSDSSSIPEVTGDAAVLIDPRNEEELTNALLRVAGDERLRCDLRERGLLRASLFSWDRTARETVQVYEELLGEKLAGMKGQL